MTCQSVSTLGAIASATRTRALIQLGIALLIIASTVPVMASSSQEQAILAPVVFAPAHAGAVETQTVSGVLHRNASAAAASNTVGTPPSTLPPTSPDWVYLPVVIPQGVNQITVSYSYDRPTVPMGTPGNAMDVGMFDQRGIQLGGGFRGWSGGARDTFSISATEATPGYLPGPIVAGTWYVIFGPYTISDQGLSWTATISLSFGPAGPPFVPKHAPDSIAGRGRTWYRGDMHLHSVYSDGKRLPNEVVSGAQAAGLDFMVSTEHNTSSADGIWGNYAQPNLLILNGEEITTRNGHYNALGLPHGMWIDWRYRATDDNDFAHFVNEIHEANALAVACHPFSACLACNWKFGFSRMDAIEVWGGPWSTANETSVSSWDNQLVQFTKGLTNKWIPAVGDSDAHSEGQVIGLPQNIVLADNLERGAILEGVKSGQLWIAESSAVNLTFAASAGSNTAGVGQRLSAGANDDITVQLTVSGVEGCSGQTLLSAEETAVINDAEIAPDFQDEPEYPMNYTTTPSGCSVRFITDQGQIREYTLPESGDGTLSFVTSATRSRFVRAEVRRITNDPVLPTVMVALTNPIFLGNQSQ